MTKENVRVLFVKTLKKNNYDYGKTIGVFVDSLNEIITENNYNEKKHHIGLKPQIERIVMVGNI